MRLIKFLRRPWEAALARWGRIPGIRTAKVTLAAVLAYVAVRSARHHPVTDPRAAERDPGGAGVGIREYPDVSPTLIGLAAAAFDTKIDKPLLPGSAAHKAHRRLRRLGCRVVRPPESFKVDGTTGPLVAGELERAMKWAGDLAAAELDLRHPA